MIVCWLCGRETDIKDDAYGDHQCPFCNVQISIYPPQAEEQIVNPATTEEEWLNEEEKMGVDYNDPKYQGKFIYMPRIGETLEVDIKEIREVQSDNPKFNFSENVPVMINGEIAYDDDNEQIFKKRDLGYHIEAEIEGGKVLSITSMSAFLQVFKKHNIQDGDKIRIEHPEKGIWKITKL